MEVQRVLADAGVDLETDPEILSGRRRIIRRSLFEQRYIVQRKQHRGFRSRFRLAFHQLNVVQSSLLPLATTAMDQRGGATISFERATTDAS